MVCAALAASVAALLARHGATSPDSPGPVAVEPAWRTAEATPAMYSIDTTLFPEDQASAEVRLHRSNTRQDVLRFGSVGSPLGFARVDVVRPGSPAARAGLRAGTHDTVYEGVDVRLGGDAIVAIDGVPVRDAADVVRIVSGRLLPGETARVTIVRAGRRLVVPVHLTARTGAG